MSGHCTYCTHDDPFDHLSNGTSNQTEQKNISLVNMDNKI
jgi:hypothetical protein